MQSYSYMEKNPKDPKKSSGKVISLNAAWPNVKEQ